MSSKLAWATHQDPISKSKFQKLAWECRLEVEFLFGVYIDLSFISRIEPPVKDYRDHLCLSVFTYVWELLAAHSQSLRENSKQSNLILVLLFILASTDSDLKLMSLEYTPDSREFIDYDHFVSTTVCET